LALQCLGKHEALIEAIRAGIVAMVKAASGMRTVRHGPTSIPRTVNPMPLSDSVLLGWRPGCRADFVVAAWRHFFAVGDTRGIKLE
jgi:hypothetical protein